MRAFESGEREAGLHKRGDDSFIDPSLSSVPDVADVGAEGNCIAMTVSGLISLM